MPRASLLHIPSVRPLLYPQIEDIGGLALIKDKQNLSQVPLPCARLDKNHLINLRLQEAQVLVGHF